MPEPRCRICLEPLDGETPAYHARCCRRLFGAPTPPALPYAWADLNALAEQILRRHVSVPGVQPKLSLHLESDSGARNRLTLVGLEGGYILKPPVAAYPEMPELEHLTLRMADAMGIETAPGGLVALQDGAWAFLSRRMDREGTHKRHLEDLCQLTDRLSERKYSGSIEQVGRAILRYCTDAGFDAMRLWELTVFCFLTGNADMHLKNFSLIYDPGGSIRLSPAYDLLPTTLLLPEDREDTALTINGKKRVLVFADFLALGRSLRLTDRQTANALNRLSERLPAAFRMISQGFCGELNRRKYAELLRERAARLGMGQ